MSSTALKAVAVALGLLRASGAGAQDHAAAPSISDNSFLIEEAYNQEPHVVQHISGLQLLRGADSWIYTFTQEWPLFGQKNQLSYALPIARLRNGTGTATGLGDVAVNYRYQLAAADRLAVAPRLSVLLPTASLRSAPGAVGMQLNLPVSVTVTRQLVTHWNAGTTLTPSARTVYNLGASAIWLARPALNALVEVVWLSAESGDELIVSPGIRWAHNLRNGLQIVPGLAYAFDVGAFAYLSFEHPFGSTVH